MSRNALDKPCILPCGYTINNRLAKAAMSELLGASSAPGDSYQRLYRTWAQGGWGLVITGNIQVGPEYIGNGIEPHIPVPDGHGADPVHDLYSNKTIQAWQLFRDSTINTSSKVGSQPCVLVQLNHPGRQSIRFYGTRKFTQPALCPSPKPLNTGSSLIGNFINWILMGSTPKEMTLDDINHVINQFVSGAVLAYKAGFNGVQIHASHGYLLSSFLSPKTNYRKDEYGKDRLLIIIQIIDRIRAIIPSKKELPFVLSVKVNSSDYVKGGITEDDAFEYVNRLTNHPGVDLIEISGGNYENAVFTEYELSTEQEGFFESFAKRCRTATVDNDTKSSVALMLTGGFRTKRGMLYAVSKNHCDIIGIGRPATLVPDLPNYILNDEEELSEGISTMIKARARIEWILLYIGNAVKFKLSTAGFYTLWYGLQMRRLSMKKPLRPGWLTFLKRQQKVTSSSSSSSISVHSAPFASLLTLIITDMFYSHPFICTLIIDLIGLLLVVAFAHIVVS